ncbi:hypothetical protein J7373_12855 [Xanthomonas sp. A2111]|uniref:META domain-containing protein n=1 Tax=Xanthomonas hawaiiensis TaxID=3003247 RepID=A0ABU2IBF5_9XANT|nr:hypothetical protein [Xanthomonas sp. A2111]MBO9829141.1 hypothetical protein [Xanthomonas sp. A2111]MDS9994973.1 hypothetical protein [Xanthomonas sp. A2111]
MRNRSRGVAHFPLWLALCLALPSAAGAAPQAATAAKPDAAAAAEALPAGQWSGTLTLEAQPPGAENLVALRLIQDNGTPRLAFGSPLNCNVLVKPQRTGGFVLDSINGGAYCDKMMGKPLRVQRSGDDLRLFVDGKALLVVLHTDPGRPSPLTGTWQGQDSGGKILEKPTLDVTVSSIPQAPGSPTVELRYGTPWSCKVQARYVGMRADAAVYSLDMNDTGQCANLSDGRLVLRATPDGGVSLQIAGKAGKDPQRVTLQRVSASR